MINISYDNGEIKVTTEKISLLYDLPLKLKIVSQIGEEYVWGCDLFDDYWASYPNNEMNDVKIYDKNDNLIIERKWDVLQNGSTLYKTLYLYCKQFNDKNIKPFGVAIGTHDGKFGEWVPVVNEELSDAILCEPTKKQFDKLINFYGLKPNVLLKNELITDDGGPTVFYEGGKGYTNSIVKGVIDKWEIEQTYSNLMNSKSINELLTKRPDWIHTDVEGYDAKLIMGINPNLLPNFLIFEHENMSEQENDELNKYLKLYGFELYYYKVSCLAIKKQIR